MDHSVVNHSSSHAHLNRAKIWQIAFFAANNLATNCYAVLMIYVSYFANGVAGFAISTVAILLTKKRRKAPCFSYGDVSRVNRT